VGSVRSIAESRGLFGQMLRCVAVRGCRWDADAPSRSAEPRQMSATGSDCDELGFGMVRPIAAQR
jgi:hypothetical protein